MAMIKLQEINKNFGSFQAVKNLSLEVERGETMVFLGSSGSGKTTVLKMINRLLEPDSGSITVDGVDTRDYDSIKLRRSMGYVIQSIGLFPHMTIGENVTLMPRLCGWDEQRRGSRTREVLQLVGLNPDEFSNRYPDELSGGQQQRVGVARALANDPEILLMDEPFGALDAVTRESLQQELIAVKERVRKTIIFVTHDIFEAFTLADRIAVMHEGRLEQVGTRDEIITAPATEFVEALLAPPRKQLREFKEVC